MAFASWSISFAHGGAKAAIAFAQQKTARRPAKSLALRNRVPALQLVISVGDDIRHCQFCRRCWSAAAASRPPARANADDPFLLLYTSGTTSSPKGVSVTFNHFLSNARLCAAEFGLRPDDRILCLAPYTHLYGLYALELGFAVGATACLLDVFHAGRIC